MAQDIPVSIDLPRDLLLTLGQMATQFGCAPSDYLCRLLSDLLDPAPAGQGKAVCPALQLALRLAIDWPDLQHRLRRTGHVLRALSDPVGELTLCNWPLEQPVMPLTALGVSRAELARRLGADFPPSGRTVFCHAPHARLGLRPRRRA
ncbi:MAG: hypothetical protein ORN49_01225 [Rhodobacteraceae bacterium]|nr:hypothetical protein [Paracoccaceae bacterium]